MPIILASQSPRRKELMELVTPDFEVHVAGVDESALTADTPARLAQILAEAKAEAVFEALRRGPVVGCDTVVALDGRVLGKPADQAEAIAMLKALSGRKHEVHTGVCLLLGQKRELFTETTAVTFASIPEEEILKVVATPEPYDKAGGYGIQGWAARFIPRIEGDYYNVMGLPVAALWQALAKAGLAENKAAE